MLLPNVYAAKDLKRQVEGGGNFTKFAMRYSIDEESRAKGGDLGPYRKGLVEVGTRADRFKPFKPGISERASEDGQADTTWSRSVPWNRKFFRPTRRPGSDSGRNCSPRNAGSVWMTCFPELKRQRDDPSSRRLAVRHR